MRFRFLFWINLAWLLTVSCASSDSSAFELKALDGTSVSVDLSQSDRLRVFFFLSPECPLCENYSYTLTELREQFSPDSVTFYGVFPGTYYDKASIQRFLSRYHPPVEVLLDPNYAFTKHLGATVTPEAFLIDQRGEVRYAGKIDNWIPQLGIKRQVVDRHYLQDAMAAALQGRTPALARTEPVGCFIE